MNLFNEQTGFRLFRLEIYNWGTFDKEIWTMNPECQTAVLTGANGSGKSTVVDALLTLLVEPRQRNYNLASGAGSSRERSERTYIRGQYSRSRGESAIEAKPNSLRDHQSHSVLLAAFVDPSQQRIVTLAQILWISNAERVERRYYVAPCELSIEEHFPQRHVTKRNLPQDAQLFTSFTDYMIAVRKAVGLGGKPRALDLFNQTAAVKDIPSLNTFVREHMLDKGDPESRVDALRTQYRELNEAHAAIQRASKQIRILTPLINAGSEYRRYEDQIIRYELAKSLVPLHVAERAREILMDAVRKSESSRAAQESRLAVIDQELANQREALERIKISIAQDNVGQEKREIEGRLPVLKRAIDALKRAADQYDGYARLLGLPVYQTEAAFYQNRDAASERQQTLDEQNGQLDKQRVDIQTELRDIQAEGKKLEREIQYLKVHPSNIPATVARIRADICTALQLEPDQLPFVGELLKVRDEESKWEGVLERLLNSFAQELIIPEDGYSRVSRYVNEHHLNGRLIYRRVNPNQRVNTNTPLDDRRTVGEMAYTKLQIVEHTPYGDWLAATLIQRFAYVCAEDLADFQQAEKAITPQGQIKHSAARHEKDDRREVSDRRSFVLGWDNRAKLRQLERDLNNLSRQLTKKQEQEHSLKDQLNALERESRAVENLLKVAQFADINWRTSQAEYDRLQRRIEALKQQSQQLQQLEKHRDVLQQEVKETERQRDQVTGEIRSLNDRIQSYRDRLNRAEDQLVGITNETLARWEKIKPVLAEVDKESLVIETLSNRVNELEVYIQRSIANFKGFQNRFESTILDAMNNFRREYPDEGVALTADIASLAAFEQIHARLETDDLPRHEERFKQMLDRTVTRGIQVFVSYLTEQERAIERSINELNESLAQVDYGGGSIIRLIADSTNDPEIHDFKRELKACIPNAGDNSPEELERAYDRIKAVIQRFDEDPNWMQRVIDVRRWRMFAAEQIDSNGNQVDYYSDSSGKSGGQKAKLAYTILASAIAHQYGLQDALPNDRTFRFVVIDEAFSKLDDENARYAMLLFERLGLQLLVVTPMQQLHVIESYVQTYHVTVNNQEGSYSRLFNLTQAEYQQRRRELQV